MHNGDRANGPTFPLDSIGFIDFETRSLTAELPIAGAYRYAHEADAIICVWAIGDGPVQEVAVERFGQTIDWADMPIEFLRFHAKVMTGTAGWAAWNCGFDRAIWNYSCAGFPPLEPEMIIDVAVQAAANGLPRDLSMAAKLSHSIHKVESGRELISLFSKPPKPRRVSGTPQSHPQQWAQFRDYARGDILAMRSVFMGTRQLPLAEWKEYWVSERINDRGVAVDLAMAEAAARMAHADKFRSSEELARLTDDGVRTVGQVAALLGWLQDRLPPEGKKYLTARTEELDDDGELVRPAKLSLKRNRVEKLLAYVKTLPEMETVTRVLELRRYGASTTPAKFSRIQDQALDSTLYGSYAFNGAPQTGRYSSRGVQIHNLARDYLDYEHEAIEALLAGVNYDTFSHLGDTTPVSRKLSLLIRPAIVAREGRILVWSDFANIEARVLPWLADTPGARARLDIFRAVDADKSVPDIYTRTAAEISHINVLDVTKAIRQRGKVVELALGFGGGLGALQAMAAGYGMHISDAEGREIVDRWRAANPWCVRFWGKYNVDESHGLWGAAMRAMERPKTTTREGRIRFIYLPELAKSLLMVLPSGRILTYRDIRHETVPDLDDDDNIVGYSRKLRFQKGYYRAEIWHGTFCENAVQAVAADLLRGTLVRVEQEGPGAIAHTHDEVMIEVADGDHDYAMRALHALMVQGFDWSEGLPIMSEETCGYYYTKAED